MGEGAFLSLCLTSPPHSHTQDNGVIAYELIDNDTLKYTYVQAGTLNEAGEPAFAGGWAGTAGASLCLRCLTLPTHTHNTQRCRFRSQLSFSLGAHASLRHARADNADGL